MNPSVRLAGGWAVLLSAGLAALAWAVAAQRYACRSADREARLGQELDARTREALLRLKVKEEIVQELIADRMTLPAAAAHFRALDRLSAGFRWDLFRRCIAGASDEERHCREVIAWATRRLARDPCRAAAFARRMEARLADLLRDGPPELPEVGPLVPAAADE